MSSFKLYVLFDVKIISSINIFISCDNIDHVFNKDNISNICD